MTDQTESEYAELLADLDFYDEDHWRNVMRQYPGAQAAIRKAAAAIRALEAKVHRLEVTKAGLWEVSRKDFVTMSDLRADRDRFNAEAKQRFDDAMRNGERARQAEIDRDRLAGEVERLQQAIKRQAASARMGMDAATRIGAANVREAARLFAESRPAVIESERAANELLTDEVARLTSELAAARDVVQAILTAVPFSHINASLEYRARNLLDAARSAGGDA